jgi:hypothetical protein
LFTHSILLHPLPRMFQRQPLSVFRRAGHALRDEVHAVHAVLDVGIQAVSGVELLADGSPRHVVEGGVVDVGERLEKRPRL